MNILPVIIDEMIQKILGIMKEFGYPQYVVWGRKYD